MDNLELLERLGAVEPPSLEVSSRVAATLEGAVVGESLDVGDAMPTGQSGPTTPTAAVRSRFGRRRLALVAAAVALVGIGSAVIVPKVEHGRTVSLPPSSSPKPAHGGARFELVDATTFPFRVLGGGANAVELDCPTSSVCYAWPNGPVPTDQQGALERSVDGGVTWQPTAKLPGNLQGVVLDESSCTTAEVCALSGEESASPNAAFALTVDGGRTWRDDVVPLPLSVPGASLAAVTCVDGLHCVAYVDGESSSGVTSFGTFLSTTDGGSTWSSATSVPETASGPLWELRCETDGSCIAITVAGSAAAPGGGDLSLQVLRSTDFGLTWTVTPAPSSIRPGPGVLLVSCGTTLDCLAAYPSATSGATSFQMASTDNGGATWTVEPAPSGWGNITIAVSCDPSGDCWVSSSTYDGTRSATSGDVAVQAGYVDPVVAVTHDNGATWSSIGVPAVINGASTAIVGALSCPSSAGCIAIGVNAQAFSPPTVRPSSPASATDPFATSRAVLSSVGGSANSGA